MLSLKPSIPGCFQLKEQVHQCHLQAECPRHPSQTLQVSHATHLTETSIEASPALLFGNPWCTCMSYSISGAVTESIDLFLPILEAGRSRPE